MSQWLKAKQKLRSDSSTSLLPVPHDSVENGANLERADPELCITLMERRLNFSGLKHRLRTADQAWMEQFLAIGGLSAIFDALETLGQRGFSSIADALKQLECVGCVKAVMNNQFGLEFIIAQPGEGFVKKLAQVLDTNNGLVKTQVFELLSALCLYSEDGYQLALDALDDYKRSKSQRYRFSLLTQELSASETQEYSACILAFINCILAGAIDLSKRVKLRNEFIALQLQEILAPWRHTADEALATQIDVFEESHSEDDCQLNMPGGIDINSHEDMFNAVLAKVFNTPHELPFLHILQSLLLLDRNAERSIAIWELLEQFCQQAVIMDSPDAQAEKLKSVSIEKLRTVLQEEQNRKKQGYCDSVSILVPPPPPPPALTGGPDSASAAPPPPPPPPPPPGLPGVPAPPDAAAPPPPPPPPLPPGVPGSVPVPPPPPPPSFGGPGGIPPPPPFPGGPGIPPPPPLPGSSIPAPPPFPGGIPAPPPLPGGVPAPPPIPGVPAPPPFPGGAPPPPPIPGGIPQPPGFYGYASAAAMAVHANMTRIEKARKHKPAKQMKKVNWVKVSKNVASCTGALWQKSAKGEEDVKVDINPTNVEDLFARPEIKKAKKDGGDKEKEKQPAVVTLLDQKTSLNVNIFLKQFKTDNASIVTMIRDGDSSKMSIDQLKALEKLLPDSPTVETLKSFNGDRSKLGTAEDFFMRLLDVKQYPLRIEAMLLRMEFSEKLEDLRPAIATLEKAIDELMTCDQLRDVLEVALTAGNIINGGGRAGDAYGITVNSLNKLKDTKSKIPRLSLLHYISQVCEEQAPDLLALSDQLPTLEKASRLSHDFLTGEVSLLSTKVKQLEKKCKKSPDDLKAQLKTFLGEAHQTLDDLQASISSVSDKMKSAAVYFCQDASKFKLEELLTELLTFVKDFTSAKKENDQRKQLEEKRKKREEAKKAAEEAKRKKLAAKGEAPAAEPEEPAEETCVIDNLLKEIRAGTTLRRTGQSSVHKRRQRSSVLKKGDLDRLNQIVEKAAATSPRKPITPAAGVESQFKFPAVSEANEKESGISNTNGDDAIAANAGVEAVVQHHGGSTNNKSSSAGQEASNVDTTLLNSHGVNGETDVAPLPNGESLDILKTETNGVHQDSLATGPQHLTRSVVAGGPEGTAASSRVVPTSEANNELPGKSALSEEGPGGTTTDSQMVPTSKAKDEVPSKGHLSGAPDDTTTNSKTATTSKAKDEVPSKYGLSGKPGDTPTNSQTVPTSKAKLPSKGGLSGSPGGTTNSSLNTVATEQVKDQLPSLPGGARGTTTNFQTAQVKAPLPGLSVGTNGTTAVSQTVRGSQVKDDLRSKGGISGSPGGIVSNSHTVSTSQVEDKLATASKGRSSSTKTAVKSTKKESRKESKSSWKGLKSLKRKTRSAEKETTETVKRGDTGSVENDSAKTSSEASLSPTSPSEDSLYLRLVEEHHSHDVSVGIASVTQMAMSIAPGTAERLDKPRT